MAAVCCPDEKMSFETLVMDVREDVLPMNTMDSFLKQLVDSGGIDVIQDGWLKGGARISQYP